MTLPLSQRRKTYPQNALGKGKFSLLKHFLESALWPSERYYETKPRLHKKLTDWARQLLLQTKRWAVDRQVVAVGDSTGQPGGYAVIDLLTALQGPVSLISRLRLDAALYESVPIPTGIVVNPRQ